MFLFEIPYFITIFGINNLIFKNIQRVFYGRFYWCIHN